MTSHLHIVCVLYNQTPSEVERLARSVSVATDIALSVGAVDRVDLHLGNCGDPYEPDFGAHLQGIFVNSDLIELGENLGHSGGCNAVVAQLQGVGDKDPLLFVNPDSLFAPDALPPLVADLARDDVGAVDARQIPFEHHKAFDGKTRAQSWASGACLGTRYEVFQAVGGFDAEHFRMYCNDVDLCWRIRLKNWKVLYTPDAVVFHDKRLNGSGSMLPTSTQDYFSTLGRLNLARRFGNQSVERNTLRWVDSHGEASHRRAARDFRAQAATGSAPSPLPKGPSVASFLDGDYGASRF